MVWTMPIVNLMLMEMAISSEELMDTNMERFLIITIWRVES